MMPWWLIGVLALLAVLLGATRTRRCSWRAPPAHAAAAAKPTRELLLHPREAAALLRFALRGGKRGTQAHAAPPGASLAQQYVRRSLLSLSLSLSFFSHVFDRANTTAHSATTSWWK